MRWPSPPRKRPAPPLPGTSSLRSKRQAAWLSITSIGVFETLLGKVRQEPPSFLAEPPIPPLWKNIVEKRRRLLSTPLWLVHQSGEPLAAMTRSGRAGASVRNTRVG